jgi:hypothetical protein
MPNQGGRFDISKSGTRQVRPKRSNASRAHWFPNKYQKYGPWILRVKVWLQTVGRQIGIAPSAGPGGLVSDADFFQFPNPSDALSRFNHTSGKWFCSLPLRRSR